MKRLPMQSIHDKSSQGFTIIELLIVAPMVVLVVTLMIGLAVSLTGDALVARERVNVSYTAQNALNRIEQDVRLSKQILPTTGTLPSPQGSNSSFAGTAAFASPSNYLVLEQYATTQSPYDSVRNLIYYANQPNACGPNQEFNETMHIMVVYYLDGTTLKRRTIVPSYTTGLGGTVCDTPWHRNSCKAGFNTATLCRASDEVIAQNVSTVNFSYYQSPGDTDPVEEPAEATRTVLASLTVTTSVAGRTASTTSVMRVTAIGVE